MIMNGYKNASLKQANSYYSCLSKKKVKVEVYPKMALLIKTEVSGGVFITSLSLETSQISKLLLFLNLIIREWDT